MMKKRILFVVQLPPPVHGASIMNKLVVESKLINKSYTCRIINLSFARKISQINKFSIFKFFKAIIFPFKLLFERLIFNPEFIYYTLSPHGLAFYRDFFFILILKITGSRMIFHLHGKGIRNNIKKKNWLRSIYKYVFRDAEVIHLSEVLKLDVEGLTKNDLWIVNNGIPKVKDDFANSKNDKIRFIYLSSLTKKKGVILFLEAVKLLKNLSASFEAIVVGGSSKDTSIDDLKLFIKENNIANVEIVGPKYGDDKYKALLSSDIFVFPTYYENECFPLSILEAMQCRLPVISTDNGAIPMIVLDGFNGFIIPQNDYTVLAQRMKDFILHPMLIEKMGNNGLKEYERKYTFEVFEQNMMKVLSQIIDKN